MQQEKVKELIKLNMQYRAPYRWPNGEFVGLFLRELKDNGKIYASKCPKCGRFLCPPREICGRCHVRMEGRGKWVEVGPRGSLLAFSVVEQPFLIPLTGKRLEVPFCTGIINLDGAPTGLHHQLEETNPDKLQIGLRVEAVFRPKEQRRGDIWDIQFFRTIE